MKIPYKISLIILGSLIILSSCNQGTDARFEYINSSLDSSIKATKISIKDLAKKYKSLHGQYVETEGIFYYEFENVSLCANRDGGCFWLDFNEKIYQDSVQIKGTTKRFTMKGQIDTSRRGHLSFCLATISNIYYIKQK